MIIKTNPDGMVLLNEGDIVEDINGKQHKFTKCKPNSCKTCSLRLDDACNSIACKAYERPDKQSHYFINH